jgi:fructokinase
MKTTPTISCIGELLVDFVSTASGVTLADAPGFRKLAGGAPANVAVGLAKLGVRSAFIGKVGNDAFGRFLISQLRRHRVNVTGIRLDEQFKTRLAFISLTKSGERDFEFWEQHPADEQLAKADIAMANLLRSGIVHISSFLLLSEPSRSTILNLAEMLRKKRCLISFDPNIRLSLWKSPGEAKKLLLKMIRFTSILRLNEDEARFLTDKKKLRDVAKRLLSLGPDIIVVTRGSKGCAAFTRHSNISLAAFHVKAVDTTGCGDGFLAGFLRGIVHAKKPISEFTTGDLTAICGFANTVAALTAKKHGAIPALPTLQEVEKFLSRQKHQV